MSEETPKDDRIICLSQLRKDRKVHLEPGEVFQCHYPFVITDKVFDHNREKWTITTNEMANGGLAQWCAEAAPARTGRFGLLKGTLVVLLIGSAFVAGQFGLVNKLRDFDFEAFNGSSLAFQTRIDEHRNMVVGVTLDAVNAAGDAVYAAACDTGRFLTAAAPIFSKTELMEIRMPEITAVIVSRVFAWITIAISAVWAGFGFYERRDGYDFPSVLQLLLQKDGLPAWSILLALLVLPLEVSARLFLAFYQIVAEVFTLNLRRKNNGDNNA